MGSSARLEFSSTRPTQAAGRTCRPRPGMKRHGTARCGRRLQSLCRSDGTVRAECLLRTGRRYGGAAR